MVNIMDGAGAPDIVAEYKGQIVLGDLKTSNNPYCSKWPDSSTPKSEYGKKTIRFYEISKMSITTSCLCVRS